MTRTSSAQARISRLGSEWEQLVSPQERERAGIHAGDWVAVRADDGEMTFTILEAARGDASTERPLLRMGAFAGVDLLGDLAAERRREREREL